MSTTDLSGLTDLVEDHIESLQWSPDTPDDTRSIVAGNIRHAVFEVMRAYLGKHRRFRVCTCEPVLHLCPFKICKLECH